MPNKNGIFAIIAGPAGVGKTSVMPLLLERLPQALAMVSTTTRPPRPGEVDGKDYLFIDADEFERRVAGGRLIEHAEYAGNRYGTDAAELQARLAKAPLVLKIMEVQGVRIAKRAVPGSVSVFIAPDDFPALERRLRARPGASEADLQERLRIARIELAAAHEFDYTVVNREGRLERCADDIADLLRSLIGR